MYKYYKYMNNICIYIYVCALAIHDIESTIVETSWLYNKNNIVNLSCHSTLGNLYFYYNQNNSLNKKLLGSLYRRLQLLCYLLSNWLF